MNASSAWFEGIVPERRTLLLVDEPVDDALLHALASPLTPIEWNEAEDPLPTPKLDGDGDEAVITH